MSDSGVCQDPLLLRHSLVIVHLLQILGIFQVVLLILAGDDLPDLSPRGVCLEDARPREFRSHAEALARNLVRSLRVLNQLLLEGLQGLVSLLGLHCGGVIGHATWVVDVFFYLIYDAKILEVKAGRSHLLGGRRRFEVRLVRGILRILPGRVLWVLDGVDQPMVAFEVLSLPLSLLYLLHNIVKWVNLSDSLLT